jgi:hypothetical protein
MFCPCQGTGVAFLLMDFHAKFLDQPVAIGFVRIVEFVSGADTVYQIYGVYDALGQSCNAGV